MRRAAIPLALALAAGRLGADPVLITEPLTLTARLESWDGLHSLRVSVPAAGGEVCVLDRFRSPGEPLQDYRSRIRRAGPYLFLPSGCGGCNAARGYGYAAFKLDGGPRYLGTVAADRRGPYAGGSFLALETTLEINALASHANGTVLELLLRERGGRLQLDRAATWARNRRRVAEALAVQAPAPEPGLSEAQRWDGPAGALLRGAALARYLGRGREEARVLERARALLPPELLAVLLRELKRLRPGALELEAFNRCEEAS